MFARDQDKPIHKQIKAEYDDACILLLDIPKSYKIYDVQDIQNELEELTEDENQIEDKNERE